ncbi:glycosyl hydrolase family 8 [Paenibacillus sp. SAF-054]
MRTRNKSRTLWNKAALLTVAIALLAWPFHQNVDASDVGSASKEPLNKKAVMLAEWKFKDQGKQGMHPATGGVYQPASTLQQAGGTFENYDEESQDISYQGWDEAKTPKYWLATLSTAGYGSIKLSSEQSSSGSGPSEFRLQISTDLTNWSNVPNGTVKIPTVSSYDCPKQSCMLKNISLPQAGDKEILYIRWLVQANKAVDRKENPSGIGGGGSSRIRNIVVTGEPLTGKAPVQPTLDVTRSPLHQAENVPAADPLSVRFSKEVTLSDENAIRVTDEQGHPAAGFHAEIVQGHTLQIQHDPFGYSKQYKVSIGKSAIQGKDGVPLARSVSWSFAVQDSPTMPKLMNMTFHGDPRTSLSFAWYTESKTGTKVQVIEATRVKGDNFPEKSAHEYYGTADEVATFMDGKDRETGHKSKFYSHKVTADQLKPGTTYKFRAGDGTEWSPVGSFTTDSETPQPYHFIVGSDSQASNQAEFEPWADTFRKAIKHIGSPKFLINAGDLVDNGDLEQQWQWLLGTAKDSLLNVPFVPVLGGHEVNDWDGDETTPNNNFYNHFNLPRNVVKATHDGSVYSFEYGDALFMVFNSEFDGKLKADGSVNWDDDKHEQFWNQVDWMRSTVAKSDAKWKFVTFHKSPYAAGDNSAQWEDQRVNFYKDHLIPVFDELGIDMVFEAHDHMYMRSFQMYDDKIVDPEDLQKDGEGNVIDPKGTVYLMSNALGNKFYYKNNQYKIGADGEPEEKIGPDGKPVPYDDYFAAIDEQPEKKMFTDVSVSDKILKFDAMTAAVEDEGKPGFTPEGLGVYDQYGIKRTDTKPNPVEQAAVVMKDGQAVISWKMPSSGETVRGFRIYEKDDKIGRYWSKYVPVEPNKEQYSLMLGELDPAIQYHIVIRAVGARNNSAKVELTTLKGLSGYEPPSAPSQPEGQGTSPYRIQLSWDSPSGPPPSGYRVYRDGKLAGTSEGTAYEDNGLEPDTVYEYTIRAISEHGAESLPAAAIAVKTQSYLSGALRPFPQHTEYAAGSITPNHVSKVRIDMTVTRLYDEWKKKYLKSNPYIKASDPAQYYVWYADGDWFEKEHDDALNLDYDAITVSEAHGYGMLITAYMAGHDPQAKAYFDGLYRYFRAHPSSINPDLMAWKQGDTGKSIVDVDGVDSATDGDMDIAYALLLADRQWGSGGKIHYLAEAKKVIQAIMKNDVNHAEWTLKLADWADDNDAKYGKATRPSDFMLQHMKDFQRVTGDPAWGKVVDKTYAVSRELFTKYSPQAGMLPDFAVKKGAGYAPAEPEFLEGVTDGNYSYNSSRTPWRIGTDALMTGDERAKEQLNTFTRWIRMTVNDDPSKVLAGYKLDGSAPLEDYPDLTFTAPMMVGAMLDASNQSWLNRLWDHNASISTEEDVYFGNTLRLLSMIVVSGNWWSPGA